MPSRQVPPARFSHLAGVGAAGPKPVGYSLPSPIDLKQKLGRATTFGLKCLELIFLGQLHWRGNCTRGHIQTRQVPPDNVCHLAGGYDARQKRRIFSRRSLIGFKEELRRVPAFGPEWVRGKSSGGYSVRGRMCLGANLLGAKVYVRLSCHAISMKNAQGASRRPTVLMLYVNFFI